LFNAAWRLTRNLDAAVEELGLRKAEVIALLVLRDHACRVWELARASGIHPSTLTDVLDRLEYKFYIRREEDVFDRRARWIELTRVGRTVAGMAFEFVQEIEFRVDDRLVSPAVQQLVRGNRLRDPIRRRRPTSPATVWEV
jgi:DNA-binding MarR family transcriptional regulator